MQDGGDRPGLARELFDLSRQFRLICDVDIAIDRLPTGFA